MVNHDRQWFGSVLAELYSDLTARSCVGYRWDASDAWSQARAPQEASVPVQHLEAWFNLGDFARVGSYHEHASSLVYAVRYQADDDEMSQGIAHASVADVAELLTSWSGPGDSRTSFTRASMTAAPGGWLIVLVEFTLRYPWRS